LSDATDRHQRGQGQHGALKRILRRIYF
jgi:hypothetical protein